MLSENETSYPDIKQSWGIVGISILAMFIFTPVIILLSPVTGEEFAMLIYYLSAMGATFWFANSNRQKWDTSTYNFELASGKITVLTTVGVIAIQVGVVSPLVSLIPIPEFMKQIFIEFGRQKSIFSAITIIIAAPILEELIFRGIILDGFLKKYSPVKSIIMSSILFGVVHLNPWQFIGAFIIGSFSGWVYYKTRKLTLSIIIHYANNLVAFVTIYFTDMESYVNKSMTEIYDGLFNMIAIILSAVIVAIVCIYFLKVEFNALKTHHDHTKDYM
jgi:membrane protease YdiL (CAAX protease family)